MVVNVAVIRYPGSNCDIETLDYFNCIDGDILSKSFYIWHKENDFKLLDNVSLIVLPGGFAFGDRIYDKATDTFDISPGTMALNSPVNSLILEAVNRKIPIIGICNGFQILTKMGLLPGELVLNECQSFVCDQVECVFNSPENNIFSSFQYLCIANSYGKYVNHKELDEDYSYFLRYYETNEIAGVCNHKLKIFGMMPHPERNNYDFKHILLKCVLDDKNTNNFLYFDKCINDLMFSEHISYKTTRKYLKNLHTKEDWVVQGPGENAGIVDIGKSSNGIEYCIAIRIESHNHPTFIHPFEGAATGVGGILRDIFTMGARPIAILDFLRFGTDDNSKILLNEAIKGISYYGNCVGVPNIGGDLFYHESYNYNPLVNVACLGIVQKNKIIYGNALSQDSLLLYVGSKTGNEGINGAAMASKTFKDNTITDELIDNVQKSDPFLEKLLLEACCEISHLKLVEGMQDMGAGGLLCATLEVVKRGREKLNSDLLGCNIYLDRVPTKYKMDPCNILISESQERMLIVCNKNHLISIERIFDKWDLEHSVIGETNSLGKYNVFYDNDLMYSKHFQCFSDFHDYTNVPNQSKSWFNNAEKKYENNFCIKNNDHSLWRVYDSTVGNRTIKGPDKKGKYSIINIHEVSKQLIVTWGENFNECYENLLLFENVKPLCIVNCLNYGDPKNCLFDLKTTIDDLTEKCKKYNIPIVGGNVSLYNSTNNNCIKPTPILVMIGISN